MAHKCTEVTEAMVTYLFKFHYLQVTNTNYYNHHVILGSCFLVIERFNFKSSLKKLNYSDITR